MTKTENDFSGEKIRKKEKIWTKKAVEPLLTSKNAENGE